MLLYLSPERLEMRVARALFRLPPPVQRLLCGGRAVRVDGQELCTEQQLLLCAQRLRGGPASLASGSVQAARKRMRQDILGLGNPEVPVASVRTLRVHGAAGQLEARHYAPFDAHRPLLVFLHGGGFALGDLDTHDAPCRWLCSGANVNVLSVAYRLAPEHPFPAAVEDALCAFVWAQRHAAELGADPTRVGVGGDSAGGNLSAVVAQLASSFGGRAPCLALLLYPGVDRATPYPSKELFGQGFYLTRDDMARFDRYYLGAGHEGLRHDRRFSPALAPDLSGLCPTLLVTAGFDPLRDEGEAYARALAAADVRVECWREPALLHGFINMVGFSPTSRQALDRIAQRLGLLFDEVATEARVQPTHICPA